METDHNLCITYSWKQVRISWRTERKDLPFNLSFSVRWRGIITPFQIMTDNTQLGCTQKITILYDGKYHVDGFTQWKYLMGGHGGKHPEIDNSTQTMWSRVALVI